MLEMKELCRRSNMDDFEQTTRQITQSEQHIGVMVEWTAPDPVCYDSESSSINGVVGDAVARCSIKPDHDEF